MKKTLFGVLIILAMSIGATATAYAEPMRQYVVTLVSYPIYVNGVEYKDEQLPALNYEGNTYIPLSKIGDILGVEYRWNEDRKRVEIGSAVTDDHSKDDPSATANTNNSSNGKLYVTDGTGKYAGYKLLHGYPDEDKYRIYFKDASQGNITKYTTKIEDLRGINLNERITWKYNGKTYTNTRSQLYSFFSDTTWFSNNLKGIGQYTLTQDWFLDVFGDVYLDWAEGIGFSEDAARWVDRYYQQNAQQNSSGSMPYVTLTPDAKFVPAENNQPQAPTIDEIIQSIENSYYNQLSEEEKQFHAEWIGTSELKNKYGIEVNQKINPDLTVELQFVKYSSGKGNDIIYTIDHYKTGLEANQTATGNGIRYMKYKGDTSAQLVYNNGGLYFNREDLRKLGIIQ